ncbi:MAG: hypothetical protein ACFWTN_02670 [Clostridium sp.]|jgi:hypothetical protein
MKNAEVLQYRFSMKNAVQGYYTFILVRNMENIHRIMPVLSYFATCIDS